MLNKILLAIILGFFVGFMPAGGQTTPTAPVRIKGKIIAARVQGHVEAVSNSDGSKRVLRDGDKVSDQTTIVTAPGANIILAFSNGATVNVAGDSNLNIEQFEQDPFAADVKLSELKQEPTTSTTKLSLTKGELVGKVVHLNVDRGSEFTVQTPVGAAGIRGTIFRIVFHPDPATGKVYFVVTTADGKVVLTRGVTTQVSIPSGKTVVAYFNYTPPTTPGGTGTVTNVIFPPVEDVSPLELTQITAAVQTMAASTSSTVFTPLGPNGDGNGNGNGDGNGNGNGNGNGGGNGNGNGGGNANDNGTDNNPSQPAAVPAPTSPQSGSGA
jgi:hypothetical protein